MKIPFSPPYIDDQVVAEVTDSLRSGWITTGPKVAALQEEIMKLTGTQAAYLLRHCLRRVVGWRKACDGGLRRGLEYLGGCYPQGYHPEDEGHHPRGYRRLSLRLRRHHGTGQGTGDQGDV